MKGTAKIKYTEAECEAALCIWEDVLARYIGENQEDPIVLYYRKHGTVETRQRCMEMAGPIDAAYNAVKGHYDDCFDWEFVPEMLTLFSEGFSEDILSIDKKVAIAIAKKNFSD